MSIARDQSQKEFKTPPLIENSKIIEGPAELEQSPGGQRAWKGAELTEQSPGGHWRGAELTEQSPGGHRAWKGGSPSKLLAAESPSRRAVHHAAAQSFGP